MKLVEQVFSQCRRNPMSTFDRYSEIEEWLCSQWAWDSRETRSMDMY